MSDKNPHHICTCLCFPVDDVRNKVWCRWFHPKQRWRAPPHERRSGGLATSFFTEPRRLLLVAWTGSGLAPDAIWLRTCDVQLCLHRFKSRLVTKNLNQHQNVVTWQRTTSSKVSIVVLNRVCGGSWRHLFTKHLYYRPRSIFNFRKQSVKTVSHFLRGFSVNRC